MHGVCYSNMHMLLSPSPSPSDKSGLFNLNYMTLLFRSSCCLYLVLKKKFARLGIFYSFGIHFLKADLEFSTIIKHY